MKWQPWSAADDNRSCFVIVLERTKVTCSRNHLKTQYYFLNFGVQFKQIISTVLDWLGLPLQDVVISDF